MSKGNILCTGGAGYIGSHTVISLISQGYDVVIIDNFCNSSRKSIDVVEKLTGTRPKLYEGDVCKIEDLNKVFSENKIDAVVHFAGLKAVALSSAVPNEYYHTNFFGSITLMNAMKEHGVSNLVFSSSATVYKPNEKILDEEAPLGCSNPYGWSKLFVEQGIQDFNVANKENFNAVILRYFNPIGAHPSGEIGESPKGIPNNLMPYVQQVAVGKLPHINITGTDYPTPDGTGVRDYIHIMDLAEGHVASIDKLVSGEIRGVSILNLGTGTGYSVLEMVNAFEKACGKELKRINAPRRPGDLSTVIANPSKAAKALGWSTKRTIDDGCESAWKWQSNYPNGFE